MGSFRPSMSGGHGTVRSAERGTRNVSRSVSAELTKKGPPPKLKKVWPEIKKLVRPRAGLLVGSFFIMLVNRAAGLVLPASTKYLIDDVMRLHHLYLLPRIIAIVLTATILQGLTSYALTQILSKAGQRLITELRTKVQEHIGRLSVSYYDSNRSGTLVARIMTDVEGVRNLIGTGLVEFVGGLLTAVLAFVYLMRLSTRMTLLSFVILTAFAFIMRKAISTIRPIFRARAVLNAEVTGRLTESLGGVRVVKGYNAEASESRVFADGAQRLLNNVISSLTATSIM